MREVAHHRTRSIDRVDLPLYIKNSLCNVIPSHLPSYLKEGGRTGNLVVCGYKLRPKLLGYNYGIKKGIKNA